MYLKKYTFFYLIFRHIRQKLEMTVECKLKLFLLNSFNITMFIYGRTLIVFWGNNKSLFMSSSITLKNCDIYINAHYDSPLHRRRCELGESVNNDVTTFPTTTYYTLALLTSLI